MSGWESISAFRAGTVENSDAAPDRIPLVADTGDVLNELLQLSTRRLGLPESPREEAMYVPICGSKLRSKRELLGGTQIWLERASGVSERQIRRIEASAVSRVQPRTLFKLAKALGCPSEELVDGQRCEEFVPQVARATVGKERAESSLRSDPRPTASGGIFAMTVTADELLLRLSLRPFKVLFQPLSRPERRHSAGGTQLRNSRVASEISSSHGTAPVRPAYRPPERPVKIRIGGSVQYF